MKKKITKKELHSSNRRIEMRSTMRNLLFTAILICIVVCNSFATTTYYTRATGNWSSSSTWATSACSGGTNLGSYPVAGDIVYICSPYTVTLNGTSACATLTINSGGTLQLSWQSITVSGVTTIAGTMDDNNSSGTNIFGDIIINSGGSFTNTGNAAFTINGNIQDDGTFSPGTGVFTFSGSSKTFSGANAIVLPNTTVNGTYTNNGTLTVNTALSGTGTLTQGTSSTLNIGGTSGISNLTATASPNTVSYTSTSGSQTVKAVTYNNLTINKSGQTATLGGSIAVNGNLTITAGTLSLSTLNINVSGTTSVSGTLSIPGNVGINYFTGGVTIGSGGTWTSTALTTSANLVFKGGIANSGTFNAGAATFNTNSQGISGTSAMSFANDVLISGAITLTNTNSGGLNVSGNLNGDAAGSTFDNQGTFNYGGTNAPMVTGTLTVNNSANTFSYASTTAGQTVTSMTYSSLTINKSGQTATLGGAVTVNGNLTVTAGTLADGGYQITGNGTGTLSVASGATLTLGTAGTATTFPTNYIAANISLDPASTVNYNSNVAQIISATPTYGNLTLTATSGVTKTAANNLTVNGALTIGTNNTLADGGYTITVKGNATNNATHSGAGKIYLNGGSGSHTISGGTSAFGNLELNDANGATWSGTGTTTVNGNLTVTAGNLNTGAFNTGLTVSGGTSVTGTLTTSSTTGTKIYGDVTINSGGKWDATAASAFTINGNITNNGTFNANSGVYTLGGSGKTIGGSNAITVPSATVTGSYTNNGIFTVSTALAGAGTLTQGTGSTLNLGGTIGITTLAASANSNTVDYNSTSGAQTIKGQTYSNLTIDKSGQTGTLGGATTINGNLTVANGTLADGGYQITGNASGTLTISSGATLTLGSATTATALPTNFIPANISLDVASTVNYNSNLAQTIPGNVTFGNLTLTTGASITKTAGGNLTVNGALTIGASNTLADAGYTITVKGNVTNNGTHSGAGEIYLNGGSGSHTISGGTSAFGNLELNDANGAAWSGTGTTTVNGNLIVTAGNLNAGVFTTGLTVSGNTSITGTYTTSSTTGTKTFGNITVNSGGTWNSTVAEAFTINGNIQNDGTFTGNTGVYTLAGSSKTLSGGADIDIPNATITGSYTNNGSFDVSTALSGAGSLAQGTNGTLKLGGSYGITTLTATANPNTVIYYGSSQTIRTITYNNLTTDNASGTATLASSITANGNLTVNTGTLQFDPSGPYTLTVAGSISVNSGATFQSHQSNVLFSGKRHTINLTGSFTNNGTVKLRYDGDDYTQLVFQGTGTSTVSGSGSWSSMAYMTLNKSTISDMVYITSAGFGTALTSGADALTTPYSQHQNPPVVFTSGTLKYNIPDELNYLIDPDATGNPTLTIPANVKIWILQGTVDLATYNGIGSKGDCKLIGQLVVDGGTVTVSKNSSSSTGTGIGYSGSSPAPVFTINGGNVDCYGEFNDWTDITDIVQFTMTGGTLTVNKSSTATSHTTFLVCNNSGSTVNFTGGTIVIQNKSTYANSTYLSDFYLGGSTNSSRIVSGTATVQFGNASTPSSQTMRFHADPNVTYPNVVIYNPGSSKVVTLAPYDNADFKFLSLYINASQIFDNQDISTSTGTHNMTINADNGTYSFYRAGTFTPRTGTVTFTGSNTSVIAGTSGTTFYNLTVNKDSASKQVTSSDYAFTTSGNLTVTKGNLILSAQNANYVVTGNLSVGTSGTLTSNIPWDVSITCLKVSGNVAIDGIYSYPVRSNLMMVGSGSETIETGTTSLSILTMQNGNFSASGTITVNDNFWPVYMATASFHTNGYTINANGGTYVAGGTFYLDGGTINITSGFHLGMFGYNGAATFSSGTMNTDEIDVGNGTQTGTLSHTGGTVNTGNMVIYSSSSYTCTGSPPVNVSGNWTNTPGATGFVAASSTVTFSGSTNSTISGAATTFYNMALNKNSSSNKITLLTGPTVTGTLSMTMGNINLNAKTLTLGTSAASTGTLSYTSGMMLKGTFNRWFGTAAVANGSIAGLYPMGDTINNYRPYYVSYPAGVSTGGSISILHTTVLTGTGVSFADASSTVFTRYNAYWTSSYTGFAGVSGTPFNIQAGASGMGEVTNVNDLRVTRLNDVVATAGTNSGTNLAPIVQRINLGLTQLSNNFYIGTTNPGTSPLPIELLSFEAKPENTNVKLSWTTATELNNDYFTVEKSSNGKDFEEVVRVKGAGNSNQTIYYSALDTDPFQGVSYYRLKQTDFNGNYKYSDIVQVVMTVELNLTVFPNPSDGTTLYIQFSEIVKDQDVSVDIYDINGKLAYRSLKTINGTLEDNTLHVDIKEKLARGVYIIRITAGDMKKMCQLVIR